MNPLIFKIDSEGRVRTWRMEQDGSRFRTIAGLLNGKEVVSGWTQARAASQATDTEQARFEVIAKYKHQLDREYRPTIEEARQAGATFHEPMLAKTYNAFPGPRYVQPKLDGIRCVARVEGLFTRQGQPITAVPHIHSVLLDTVFKQNPHVILDGELYNHDFKDDFGAISSIVRKKNPTADQLVKAESLMQYHVYDMAGTGIDHHPFPTRLDIYRAFVLTANCPDWIVPVETLYATTQEQADEHYGHYVELGYEGAMYRCPNAPYEIGKRSSALLKRKQFLTQEFKLKRIEEGKGNWAGLAKRAVLELEDGREFGAGIRGDAGRAKQLLNETYEEATVRFFCLSPDGVPRFPVVIDFHKGKRVD